jgi:hypothetical protein
MCRKKLDFFLKLIKEFGQKIAIKASDPRIAQRIIFHFWQVSNLQASSNQRTGSLCSTL